MFAVTIEIQQERTYFRPYLTIDGKVEALPTYYTEDDALEAGVEFLTARLIERKVAR